MIKNSTRKRVQFVFATLAALAAGVLTTHIRTARAQSGRVPFTVTGVRLAYRSSGELRATESFVFAFSQSGTQAMVRQTTPAGGRTSEYREITDVEKAREFALFPLSGTVQTYPVSAEGLQRLRLRADPKCRSAVIEKDYTIVPGGRILGYDVMKLTEAIQTPSGPGTSTRWLAPALNCFALRELVVNGSGSKLVYESQTVIPGDPDPNLFVVPSGYVERTPSELFYEDARRRGEPVDPALAKSAETFDKGYHKRREGLRP